MAKSPGVARSRSGAPSVQSLGAAFCPKSISMRSWMLRLRAATVRGWGIVVVGLAALSEFRQRWSETLDKSVSAHYTARQRSVMCRRPQTPDSAWTGVFLWEIGARGLGVRGRCAALGLTARGGVGYCTCLLHVVDGGAHRRATLTTLTTRPPRVDNRNFFRRVPWAGAEAQKTKSGMYMYLFFTCSKCSKGSFPLKCSYTDPHPARAVALPRTCSDPKSARRSGRTWQFHTWRHKTLDKKFFFR